MSWIIYLTDPERPWTAEDGGALELYPLEQGTYSVITTHMQSTCTVHITALELYPLRTRHALRATLPPSFTHDMHYNMHDMSSTQLCKEAVCIMVRHVQEAE